MKAEEVYAKLKKMKSKWNEVDNKIEALKTSQSIEYGGTDVICNNTLVSRTYDMLIKGQTYQNLFKRINSQTTQEKDNNYILTGLENAYSILRIYPSYILPKNNKYTVIIDVKDINVHDGRQFKIDGFNVDTWVCGTIIETTGLQKILLQGDQDITEIKLQINNGINCNITVSKNIIILEGDWTNKEVPSSITGIESAGQKENKISILSNNKSADDIDYKEDKKEILLPIEGGLKSLSNGVDDTIEQRNDGVYLVQRVGKLVLNGSEEWVLINTQIDTKTFYCQSPLRSINHYVICDKIKFIDANYLWTNDVEGIGGNGVGKIHFRINRSRLSTQNVNGLKEWLQTNPLTVYYELKTPVETKLDIQILDLEVYKDVTYVTTENAIQPALSFKVPSNTGGIMQENSQNINELYKLIDEVIIPQLINNSADIEILKSK